MNKYYTPRIEEFCIGFICEYRTLRGIWEPVECDAEMLALIFSNIKEDNNYYVSSCRVKYLDREDIESLGFVHIDGSNQCRYIKKDQYDRKYKLYFGQFINGYGAMSIDVSLDGFNASQIFRGVIKNKLELSRLLKQLNIK